MEGGEVTPSELPMKPSAEKATLFIQALQKRGWRIQGDEIHSEESYLHFPYPDGWLDSLEDLRQLMLRRRDRFAHSPGESHFTPEVRSRLVRVHSQALEAIAETEALMRTASAERLPTREEIADDRLDGFYAIKHFHGKSLAEAEEMFAEAARTRNPLTLTEDLSWMEPIGFRFYIQAAIRFALSESAAGESLLIDGLAGTISLWHEHHSGELIPCARLLAEFCGTVVQQFDRYDADPEIFVGLREEYQRLAGTFARLAEEPGNIV